MDGTTRQTHRADSAGGADQYLSSLLQLAFVISKLLLKTDLLKGGRQKESHQGNLNVQQQHKHNMFNMKPL